MTPEEVMSRLDRICELVELGHDALSSLESEVARIGRTALRLAKSEVAKLKDEAALVALMGTARVPSVKLPKPRGKKK